MAELVDIDLYKEYKDIKSTTRDGKIQSLIVRVSALVENYCNRTFVDYSSTPKTEWFDACTNSVDLTEFPVIAVNSVKTSTDGGVTQTTLTEADSAKDGYFVDLDEGRVYTQIATNKFLDSYDVPYRSLEVEYTAGYAQEDLPEDLKLAILDLVHYYEQEEGVPSKSMIGGTLDNALPYIANSFPPQIRRVLDLYRYSPS